MDTKKGDTIVKIGETDPVRDKYRIVTVLFAFVGIIHFLPASFFTTANDYWMYKFRNTSFKDVDSAHRTTLQVEFAPSVTISAHVASVVFAIHPIFFASANTIKARLYGSLITVLVLYIVAAIFINVDTDSWQMGFFVLTMFSVAGINGMGAIFGISGFSIIAKFPETILKAYVNGQGVAGIVSAALQVVSLAVGISTDKSANVYFWSAIGMITFGLIYLVTVFRYNEYFLHYDVQETKEERIELDWKETWAVTKYMGPGLQSIFFYLLANNAIHPAITALVVSEGEGGGEWNDVYFVPVTTYVLTAVSEYLGRLTTIRFSDFLTDIQGKWHFTFNVVRSSLFFPLIMFCNAQPRHHLEVLLPHDYQYIILIILFAFTNGYAMTYATLCLPKTVPPEKLEKALHLNVMWGSTMMGALAVLGFFTVDLL